ncbi:transposase [Spirobacillus cienkowskii]|uniref:RNA-guided endonuclease InsQ/TnpB family protein n=1 Tax=Spirobacillus cienkowskii TaxID=495820 RepID=UPI0030D24A5D
MITTYHYRIKDSGKASRVLSKMSRSVNMVWNFCKQTQQEALKNKPVKLIDDKKSGEKVSIPYFLTKFEMNNLVSGSSKELELHSQTVQFVSEEYITRRKQFKALLRWRGKKSLGWVPFKSSAIKINNGKISYNKNEFSFWNSRELPEDAKIKTGSFCQDKSGHWYLNVAFESDLIKINREDDKEIGIDIGIKTLATCSNGKKIERPNLRKNALAKLRYLKRCQRFAQRKQSKSKKYHSLPKAKLERKRHVKVANIRQDYLHKESTKLVKKCSLIVVGDVPCKLMNRNKKLAGISLDSGIGMFKNMLRYKAVRAGAIYKEISERDSTRTCSKCSEILPRIGLGVRHWNCEKCGAVHDRDVNASRNILRAYRASRPYRA